MDHINAQRPPRTVRSTVAFAAFLCLVLIVVAACGSKSAAEICAGGTQCRARR